MGKRSIKIEGSWYKKMIKKIINWLLYRVCDNEKCCKKTRKKKF